MSIRLRLYQIQSFPVLLETRGIRKVIPKGWLALRGVLGFDGTAHELLVDLAASGSGVLFLDNLDFYAPEDPTGIMTRTSIVTARGS